MQIPHRKLEVIHILKFKHDGKFTMLFKCPVYESDIIFIQYMARGENI